MLFETTARSAGFALALLAMGVLSMLASPVARAQSDSETDISFSLGGIIQAEADYGWVSRADEADERARIGYSLRRTRLLASAGIGPKMGAFIHLDADDGTFGVLDAFVIYNPTPQVRLRLGRMASAQPRAFILTPVIAMDATERAAIALLWHGGTLGGKGRSFGLDARYMDEQVEAILFLHNGYGSFDRLLGNYQQSIVSDVTGGADRGLGDMAVSAYIAYRPKTVPGVEVGGYAGYNGSENPNTAVGDAGREYASYSAHMYWGATPGSQPVRLKADLIGVRYEELSGVPSQHTLGFSMLGAVAVHPAAEFFGRFETYDPDLNSGGRRDFFVTAGMSFSPSRLRGRPYAQERITLGYNMRFSEEDNAPLHHLLVLQVQVAF